MQKLLPKPPQQITLPATRSALSTTVPSVLALLPAEAEPPRLIRLEAPEGESYFVTTKVTGSTLPPALAVMDSGTGGLAILAALRQCAPWVQYSYVADIAWMPYGDKPLPSVRRRLQQLFQQVRQHDPVMAMVLACNTASASLPLTSVWSGDKEAALPAIIDIISPTVAALAALLRDQRGRTLPQVTVLCTPSTAQSLRYQHMVAYHELACQLHVLPCPALASAVEHQSAHLADVLQESLAPVLTQPPDIVVLGCTHYCLIAEHIAAELGNGVQLVNPAQAVATAIAARLPQAQAGQGTTAVPPIRWYTTGPSATSRQALAHWQQCLGL